jgi:hypothetical protein
MPPPELPDPSTAPQIIIGPDQMAGVWANFARVSHSPFEFTVDFARLDFAQSPPQGIVVSRVSLSPLFVTQLISALQDQWSKYAEKSFPPEAMPNAAIQDDPGQPPDLPDA